MKQTVTRNTETHDTLKYRVSCRISEKEKQVLEAIAKTGDFTTLSDFIHSALNICARIYLRNSLQLGRRKQNSKDNDCMSLELEIANMFRTAEDDGGLRAWAPDVNQRM